MEEAQMSGMRGFTAIEIREFVHEYYLQPHGTKGSWLKKQPFTPNQFRRWRKTLLEGDLDRNLIPREHGGMTRSRGEWTAFEKARAKEIADHEAQISQLNARIRELEGTNSALGKAIGLLHERSEQEPDLKTTIEHESSLKPSTDSSPS
ncbi:hypothetical protein M3C58_15150 [Brachybacterium muris]|nr:hypothetical protein [Brachybacterium muris]MCT1999497.1 hypothetical protein [Brachybacterium muris]MCT2262934.1 hypothetical protein [Brachybacterium muris]